MNDDDRGPHDVQNQLAVIHGFAEVLLAEADAADPRRPEFEAIHKAAVTALDLMARLHPTLFGASPSTT